jgi:hypothetical protein
LREQHSRRVGVLFLLARVLDFLTEQWLAREKYWLDRRFFLKTARRPKKKSLGRRTTVLPAKKNDAVEQPICHSPLPNMKITAVVLGSASCNHRRSAAWSRGMILASDAEHPWFESD